MIVSQIKRKADSSAALAEIARSILNSESEIDQNKEHFWTIGLNTKLVVQYVELVSLGTLDASLVHPREVFRLAVMKGVATIAVVHNHPSGDTSPSREDHKVTKALVDAGKILGIHVLDHIVIGPDSYYSFAENGTI